MRSPRPSVLSDALASLGLAALLATTIVAPPAAAADAGSAASGARRGKICLVLSGGGARGAAHVGVIKVLEEHRVPIHCIVGTSMGALVGAAYATGMSVDEMNTIVGEISTELLFKESPPRQELSIRRKQDDYTILFGPELGIGGGSLKLPKGIVSGVQLETVLRRLSKAKGFYRFSELPIDYRAVATDLVTGKAVIFTEGELANVMRASMSVPGAIAPAEFGGMMLVDGMLTSNLPVETARAMGADIIIAVNVGTPLLRRDQLSGILGVTGQMLSILTEQNVQASLAQLKDTDILISPELGDFSTGDFDSLQKIVPLGAEAARKVSPRLAQLAAPADEYAALRARQTVAAESDLRAVDEIRFERLSRVNPRTAQATMATSTGVPIDQAKLDADMRLLYGTGDFEHVNYSFLEEPGRRVLAVDAVEKSWGPDYLRFGLGLVSDFTGQAHFNILARYRKTWLNPLGGEWRTDVQVGRSRNLLSEFYQPLDALGRFFVAPRVNFELRTADLYDGEDRIATYRVSDQSVGLDVGTQFGVYGELRLGTQYGKLKPSLETGPESLAPGESSVDVRAFTARLLLDRVDSVRFPREGWRVGAKIHNSSKALGSDDQYTKWDMDGTMAVSLGEHTLQIAAKVGGKLGSDPLPRYDLFQWGGFLQLSGYSTGQLTGENLRFGRFMYYHRILRQSLFEGAYGGFSLETGRVGNPLVPGSPDGWLRSASVFVASDTPVGPAYLGYGRAQDGNSSYYFFLGRPF